MKEFKKIAFVLIALLMVFVIVGCDDKPTGYIPGTPEYMGNGNGLSASDKQSVENAISAVLTTIDLNVGNSSGTWNSDEFHGDYVLTMTSGNGWVVEAGGYRGTGYNINSRALPGSNYDIQFTITSDNAAGNGEINITLDGKTYTTEAEDVVDTADVPVKSWDISVRLAKHSRGTSEDHDNWKYVDVKYSNGVANVDIKLSDMAEFISSDSTQAEKGDKPWFAVLIGTGIDDITTISFNGSLLPETEVSNRNDMLGAYDDTSAADDEFVLWLCADDMIEAGTKTYTLSKDNADPVKITFNFTQVMGDEDYETLIKTIKSFGHDRILRDLHELFETNGANGFQPSSDPDRYGSISASNIEYNGSSSISMTITAEDYKFCGGKIGAPTVGGEIELVLSGTGDENSFNAERYTFNSAEITFSNNIVIGLDNVSGYFSSAKFPTNQELDNKALTITIGENLEPETTDFRTATTNPSVPSTHAFWLPDSGSLKYEGMELTIDDFMDYIEANPSVII